MKLLIVAGGGGHFAAALSIIHALPKEVDFMVVIRKHAFEADNTLSLEYQTAQKLGIKFATLTTGRLQRKLSPQTVLSLAKIPVGFSQAVKILTAYKPDVVLSFGGYVAIPIATAANIMRIPVVVHEQILGAGLANRIVGHFAKTICISWESSRRFFPGHKVVLTGNPVKKIQKTDFTISNPEKLPVIYITGGSAGAHGINIMIEQCLEKLLEKFLVIHQTGDAVVYKDFDRLSKKKDELPLKLQKRYTLTKFVDPHHVFGILEKADLVVSRSGINTVTELLYLGKPALFIPLPHGQKNEQLTNALFVKNLGLCEIAEEKMQADTFFSLITDMIKKKDQYKQNKDRGQKLIHPDAAEKIIAQVMHGN